MPKRLFVISNRLPITIEQFNNEFIVRQSSGGLISAVDAYMANEGKATFSERIWVGAPGCSEKVWRDSSSFKEVSDYTFLPVFVNSKKYESYYNGFSNSLIWPLFHYFPSYAEYNPVFFDAYVEVNERFVELLEKNIRKNDVVWIHDYHLLPLANLLRKKFPSITIGFFLHIPFPSYELFRLIPKLWQKEILIGMLGADLIGFHTIDYTSHFLHSVEMVLKAEHDGQYITWQNRPVKVDAFPISIDYQLFNNAYEDPGVVAKRQEFMNLKGSMKLLFSVDRLDYTKGVYKRLQGYKQFLLQNPDYREKVIFTMVVVPSRHSITKYAERKSMIDEFIGDLNSTLGNISWQPVIYQYGYLNFDELVGLYTACDLALITPLRDGMNLVSKEFVASRKDRRGVLVLSEMAGAARELTEALLINPNDIAEMAGMIKTGLEMPPLEQEQRITEMQEQISSYDINVWAADFFNQLAGVKKIQRSLEIKMLDSFARERLLESYASSAKRIFLLDYDGTLVPFSKEPGMASPDEELLVMLGELSAIPENTIYIISGRDSNTLEKWLGHLPLGLVAEHGAIIRHPGQGWLTNLPLKAEDKMADIKKIMNRYVSRCPNSFIEEKTYSVAWHYRNAELDQGMIRAKELYDELIDHIPATLLNVLNGNKVIEVRNKQINKGNAVNQLLDRDNFDFIFAVGDDKTDEDMFRELSTNPVAFTVKVGNEASFARYNLYTPYQVKSLLQSVSDVPKKLPYL